MPVAPRITSAGAPVQLGQVAPKAAPMTRITTAAPQKGIPSNMQPKSMPNEKGMPSSLGPKYYSKGGSTGSASKRADGIAKKGKTAGKQIKMAGSSRGMKSGGKC